MTPIRVELELADGTFTSRMLRAGETVSQFQRNVARSSPELTKMAAAGQNVVTSLQLADRTTKGFLGTLRDVSIVAGIVSIGIGKISNINKTWIGDIVRTNMELERMTFLMRSMSTEKNGMVDAANQIAWLREQAKTMPFALEAINNSFVKLRATGTDPMNGSLRSLADGIAAFGGADEQLKRVILGISQMSGKGVIQMEEMRQQVAEHMPRAMELMARSMGISMAKLIKEISTGRVEAKNALAALFEELDRTFGGQAERMMNTFSGQLQKVKTQLQILATDNGLRTLFYDGALKNALKDFNDFLQTQRAKDWANALGSGLANVVGWLRTGVETAFEFRGEIGRIATVLAAGIGIRALIGSLSSFNTMIMTTVTNVRALSMNWGRFNTLMTLSSVNLMSSGGSALKGLSFGIKAVGVAIGTTMAMVGAVAPVVVGLGLAAYTAAEYFGLLSDRTAEAYDELVKYGSESEAQAKKIIAAQRESLEERIKAEEQRLIDNGMGGLILQDGELVPDDSLGELGELTRKMRELEANEADILAKARARESARYQSEVQRDIDDRIVLINGEYDRRMIDLMNFYKKEEKAVLDSDGNIEELERNRAKAMGDIQKSHYEEQLKMLREVRGEQEKLVEAGSQAQREGAVKSVASINSQIRQVMETLENFEQRELKLIPDVGDTEAAFKKGEEHLNKLKERISALRAELIGTNPEMAKLNEMLAQKDFGDMGEAAVRKLADSLRDATREAEILERLTKSRSKLKSDVERVEADIIERRMDLLERQQNRKLSEAERLQMRFNAGFYEGYGPVDKIRQALMKMHGDIDVAGSKSNQLSNVWQTNTFGDPTLQAIDGVNAGLRETAGLINTIGGGLQQVSFGNAFKPGDRSWVPNFGARGMRGGMLDLIADAEGTDKGRGYNETLAYGKFTGGNVNLTSMTLDQIDALQSKMLQHPDNTFNSSALGRYQIVQRTLKDLRAELGLSGNELFDENMQDRLAERLLARRGGSIGGLRNEWQGLRNVPASTIGAYYDADLEARQLGDSNTFGRRIGSSVAESNQLQLDEFAQDRIDYIKGLKEKADQLGNSFDKSNTELEKLQQQIKNGDFGKNLDPAAKQYEQMVAAAKDWDAANEKAYVKKKAMEDMDRESVKLQERHLELTKDLEEANRKAMDPLSVEASSAYRQLDKQLDEYIRNAEAAYGKDSEQFRAASARKTQMMGQQLAVEARQMEAKWAAENRQVDQAFMTQAQLRQFNMSQEIAQVDAHVAEILRRHQLAEEDKIRLVEASENRKAEIRRHYAAQDPMAVQMRQWSDIGGNFTSAQPGWMNQLAGGISGSLLAGNTSSLQQSLNSIASDSLNMVVKKLMADVQQASMVNKTGASAGKAAGGKAKVGVAHTGGIAGQLTQFRAVNTDVFKTARRYHSGGLVGDVPGVFRGEVPIIAKEGEGVLTPEMMKQNFSGNQMVSISAPITVSGSAGTREQNDDLAKQMSREMEKTMRGVVVDELRKQARPGNMLKKM